MALFEEPSSTVCMPRIWLSGLPSIHTRSKIVPTTWKLEVLLGPTLSTNRRTRSPGFAGSGFVTMPLCTPLNTVCVGCAARSRSPSSTYSGAPSTLRLPGSGLA